MRLKAYVSLLITATLIIGLSACGKTVPEPDPHEGMVFLYDGYDWIWYTPIEGVPVNDLEKEDFVYENGMPKYTGNKYEVKKGIDVSEHQLDINWQLVAGENLDFAYIRLGRRGYTQGGIFLDEKFKQNMDGAKAAGLEIGVYFYSQAITVSEAIEEAQFVIENLKGYSVDLPVAYDWEIVKEPDSRTANAQMETITDCTIAFCEEIKKAGYTPIVYYNRTSGYYRFDLSRLTDYNVWFSLFCTPPDVTFPSFYYKFDIWQFSDSGTVAGISTPTDFNYLFVPLNGS